MRWGSSPKSNFFCIFQFFFLAKINIIQCSSLHYDKSRPPFAIAKIKLCFWPCEDKKYPLFATTKITPFSPSDDDILFFSLPQTNQPFFPVLGWKTANLPQTLKKQDFRQESLQNSITELSKASCFDIFSIS